MQKIKSKNEDVNSSQNISNLTVIEVEKLGYKVLTPKEKILFRVGNQLIENRLADNDTIFERDDSE